MKAERFGVFYYPRFKSCPTTSPTQMAAGISQTPVRKVNTYYILTNLDSLKHCLKNILSLLYLFDLRTMISFSLSLWSAYIN